MMAALIRMLRRKPVSQLTDDARMMLRTYGKQINFVDFETLGPLMKALF